MTDKNASNGRSSAKPESHHKRYRRRVRRLRRRRRTLKWFLRTAAITTLALIVVAAVGLAGAEYYTAQPDFCASCHVMEPYYQSWAHDIHGEKLGIRCVDCHYAPGEKYTITAKFKGLSQAVSYFSGRYGTSRPRAHVKNESCLRSACHGDQAFLPKPLLIGERRTETRLVGEREVQITRTPTVEFYHQKHLRVDERLAETTRDIEQTSQQLEQALPTGGLERIKSIATSVAPAEERDRSMRALMTEIGDDGMNIADAFKLMELEHRMVRLRQLAGLNCAACHSYDASGGDHFKVDRQTCYTCHFTHEIFNRGTGACLNCHEPPTRQIIIHETTSTTQQTPVLMNHQDIVARGIDCASCHLDVIRGDAAVSARECTHCHDQAHYLANFETRTTETVAEYHRVHVAKQRARCVDCHQAIKHELLDPREIATSSGFIEPVLNDCRHCHPNHHSEQVALLQGVGGEGVHRNMPNAMFGSRLNCRACHTQPGSDFKGAPLVEATAQTCVVCHGEDYRSLFDQWVHEIAEYLRQAEEAMARVAARADQIRSAGGTAPMGVDEAIADAAHNIALVRAANGIHNKNYALQLLDLAVRSLDEAMAKMTPQP